MSGEIIRGRVAAAKLLGVTKDMITRYTRHVPDFPPGQLDEMGIKSWDKDELLAWDTAFTARGRRLSKANTTATVASLAAQWPDGKVVRLPDGKVVQSITPLGNRQYLLVLSDTESRQVFAVTRLVVEE